PRHDLTYVFYDCEEVEAVRNGLGRVSRNHRDWLVGDLAIVMEPSTGEIEAGCQGTLRVEVRTTGTRAHSARSWLGENAIHRAGELFARLAAYEPREPLVDGEVRLDRRCTVLLPWCAGAQLGSGRAQRCTRPRRVPRPARARRVCSRPADVADVVPAIRPSRN